LSVFPTAVSFCACHRFFGLLFWYLFFFFFSSRRRHTRSKRDWSSDVCSSDLHPESWRVAQRIGCALPQIIAFHHCLAAIRSRLEIGRASWREQVQVSAAMVAVYEE